MFVHFVYDKFDGENGRVRITDQAVHRRSIGRVLLRVSGEREEREGVLESEETVDETKRQSERELREVLESQEGVERGEEDEREFRE